MTGLRLATSMILVLGGLLTPIAAEARQAAKVFRSGYVSTDLAANPRLPEAFRQGLGELGYVEGRNVVIVAQAFDP